jgi:hypothetical protein
MPIVRSSRIYRWLPYAPFDTLAAGGRRSGAGWLAKCSGWGCTTVLKKHSCYVSNNSHNSWRFTAQITYYFIMQTNTEYQWISVAEWRGRPQAAPHFATPIIPLQAVPFVSAFAKVRKVTSNSVMSVSLPIRPSVLPFICPSAHLHGKCGSH